MEMQRKSNFEILRILCVFGILCMHMCSSVPKNTMSTLVQVNAINSVFNIGVSCFVLMSGYFEIKFNKRKLFSLWYIVYFYSMCDLIVCFFLGKPLELQFLVRSFLPTVGYKWWYFTTYFLLVIFSPYINQIPIKLTKCLFERLLILLLLFFYIFPTIFYFEILQDGGKGPVNMLIVYLIGRYIAIYGLPCFTNRKRRRFCLGISLLSVFSFNAIAIMISGSNFHPFDRDNSIFILMASIGVFYEFSEWKFYSAKVNMVGRYVFAIYISEGIIRNIINTYFSLEWLDGNKYFVLLNIGLALCVFCSCLMIEYIRKNLFGRFENRLYTYVECGIQHAVNKCKNII